MKMVVRQASDSTIRIQASKKIFLAITFLPEISDNMKRKNTFRYKTRKGLFDKKISNKWFRVVYKKVLFMRKKSIAHNK
jgi:hypothetical protein